VECGTPASPMMRRFRLSWLAMNRIREPTTCACVGVHVDTGCVNTRVRDSVMKTSTLRRAEQVHARQQARTKRQSKTIQTKKVQGITMEKGTAQERIAREQAQRNREETQTSQHDKGKPQGQHVQRRTSSTGPSSPPMRWHSSRMKRLMFCTLRRCFHRLDRTSHCCGVAMMI
jgi:hypothetical protein